jgi:signal transduction histidine kinase
MSETHPRISLLVVEDDADQRFLIERRLQEMDVEIRLVATGKEALASLQGIDLVLLDYRLPDMTGMETLQAIREADGPSVMMVTGMGSESVAVEAMRSGAIDYVVKDATYLRNLPEIVERGWRQHDLTRRAGRLQKLALVVSEAESRDEMLSEIVNGARELLDAAACALAVPEDGGGPQVVASTSGMVRMESDLMGHVQRVMTSRAIESLDTLLLVPLTKQDDEAVGVLIVVSEIGKVYRTEEVRLAETFASFGALALRKLRRQELEQALIDELQRTLELRRDFINSVSHELRTPLACISGFSTTLINYWGRLDEETTLSSIEKISHHAADLAKLVDALLDFGALEHGRLGTEIEVVQLKRDVELVVEDLQPLLADRTVNVEVPDISVMADRALLKRVFINLLSNAVKASEAGSTVTVRAVADNMAEVEVVDEGVGLSEQELERVFDPFWRSRGSVKAAKRGAGIGLTLVREYVRTMGGQVSATSEQGKGATFRFTLPMANGVIRDE